MAKPWMSWPTCSMRRRIERQAAGPMDSDIGVDSDGTTENLMVLTGLEEVPFRRRRIEVRFRVVHGQPMGKVVLFPVGREFLFGRGAECVVRANSDWVS